MGINMKRILNYIKQQLFYTQKKSIANLDKSFSTSAAVHISSNCTIGKYCSLGPYSMIEPGQHPTNFLSTSSFQYLPALYLLDSDNIVKFDSNKPCIIGNDVWIGANAIIQDGITISHGAIIGSNAVVTKDVPPYAIVAGIPAKIIKYRFSNSVIEKLLELKWWDLDIETIKNLPFSDIDKCIKHLEKIKLKEHI